VVVLHGLSAACALPGRSVAGQIAFLLERRERRALVGLDYLSSVGTGTGVGDRASEFGLSSGATGRHGTTVISHPRVRVTSTHVHSDRVAVAKMLVLGKRSVSGKRRAVSYRCTCSWRRSFRRHDDSDHPEAGYSVLDATGAVQSGRPGGTTAVVAWAPSRSGHHGGSRCRRYSVCGWAQ
jgi:hypothetical protein